MTYAQTTLNVHVTGRRVVATLVDGVLLGLVYTVFNWLFGLDNTVKDSSELDFTRLSTGGSVGWFVVALLYYVLMESMVGRTLGKMVTGIRVVSESSGSSPSTGAALLRTLFRVIDGFAGYLLGFIVVLNSSRRRRLGDMVAGTLVVRA
jgi:uncharacterized RDD family membrane protein YckC